MNFLSETVLGTLGTCKNEILHVPRTVLEISCCDAPARLGTKGADLQGISNKNLPF